MNLQTLNKLKIETEKGIQNVFDELEKQSVEFQIDEFNGHKREDFIIKFDRFEYHLNEKGEKEYLRVKLGIYIEDEDDVWVNALEPVGNYIQIYDFEETFIDEYFTIESKEKGFGIEHWIEILNNTTPKKYYRRNMPQYEFVTYINHTFSLFQGRNFEVVFTFLNRCICYLEIPKNKKALDRFYLENAKEYLKYLYFYLKNNELIDEEKIKKNNIEERIKTKN